MTADFVDLQVEAEQIHPGDLIDDLWWKTGQPLEVVTVVPRSGPRVPGVELYFADGIQSVIYTGPIHVRRPKARLAAHWQRETAKANRDLAIRALLTEVALQDCACWPRWYHCRSCRCLSCRAAGLLLPDLDAEVTT